MMSSNELEALKTHNARLENKVRELEALIKLARDLERVARDRILALEATNARLTKELAQSGGVR